MRFVLVISGFFCIACPTSSAEIGSWQYSPTLGRNVWVPDGGRAPYWVNPAYQVTPQVRNPIPAPLQPLVVQSQAGKLPPKTTAAEEKASADYGAAYKKAMKTGQPLLAWVGQKPRDIAGMISVYQAEFPQCKAPCVVVSKRQGDKLLWLDTIQGAATNAQIDKSLNLMPDSKQSGALPEVTRQGGKSLAESGVRRAAPVFPSGLGRRGSC